MRLILATFLSAAAAFAAAQVPRPSPEFSFTLPDGKTANLNQFKGKVVVLEFMYTTCPHCQQTSRVLTRLNSEFGKKGLQPLGVAINANPDISNFIRQFGVNYPVGAAAREAAMAYLQQSVMNQSFYVPQLVFIDRTGTIRAQYGGTDPFFSNEEANVRAMLEKLLSEPAPVTKRPVASRKKAS
jgi:peroxiredoxin